MALYQYIGLFRKALARGRSRTRTVNRQPSRPQLELLEERVVPTTDTWISSTSGSWGTASN